MLQRRAVRRTARERSAPTDPRPPARGDEGFRKLVESLYDHAIATLDRDGRVVTWSEGARRITGYGEAEVVGRSPVALYPPDEADRFARVLEAARRDERVEEEGWLVRKDGTRFWANVVVTAMRDDEGALVGFAAIARDRTRRRAAELALATSEQRFRLLIATVTDYAIFMLDPTGHVATWNEGAQRIKGYGAGEIVGRHFSVFYPEEDVRAGKCEHELIEAARLGSFEDEGWRIRKDGTRFWANVVITAMRDDAGELVGFAKVTRDLTARRAAEQQRVRLAQAEEAIRMRDEFLSIASHELRTPLTTLQMQVEAMEAQQGELSPKMRTRLERIARSTGRLMTLIDALLDVSRIATRRLTLQRTEVDLAAIARDVIDRLHEVSTRARTPIVLRADAPVVGWWDAMRVEQVLSNLLANALKYAPGAPIEVAVDARGDDAVLTVTDRGPGLPPQDLERIFRRFERAVPMQNYGGLGLGLYLSREIVEAHGGEIHAENVPSGGARFVARLPREASPPKEAP